MSDAFQRKLNAAADSNRPSPAPFRQGSFKSMFEAVPSSMRKFVRQGESSLQGVFSGSKMVASSYYHVLEVVEDSCCGKVGISESKMCVRKRDACEIAKHSKSRFEDVEAGVFLRASGEEVFRNLHIPLALLEDGQLQALLDSAPSSIEDAQAKLEKLGEVVRRASAERSAGKKRGTAAEVNTPHQKIRKLAPLEDFNSYQQAKSTISEPGNEKALEKLGILQDRVLETLVEVSDNSMTDINRLEEKVSDFEATLGVPPQGGSSSLWLAHAEVTADLAAVQKVTLQKADKHVVEDVKLLDDRILKLDRQLGALENTAARAFIVVEDSISDWTNACGLPPISFQEDPATRVLPTAAVNTGGGVNPLPRTDSTVLPDLIKKVENVEQLCTSIASADGPSSHAIRIGKYCFQNMEDLRAWGETALPPGFPFGSFIDAYSFYQRVNSHKDVSDEREIVSMEKRSKVNVTADEAIVVKAFGHPLPKCFNGASSEDRGLHHWLPGIRCKAHWEDKFRMNGVKIMIQNNIEIIRSRMLNIIRLRLAGYPEAAAFARELLADTISFVTAFSTFISDTFADLERVGFGEQPAWDLVGKLANRMFAGDCYLKRGVASEMLDCTDHKTLAVGMLWGTFATHQVLREYQKHGIENHPSIASEYVRFLVANSGGLRIEKLELKYDSLEKSIKELTKAVESIRKIAGNALNKADEANLSVKKLKEKK